VSRGARRCGELFFKIFFTCDVKTRETDSGPSTRRGRGAARGARDRGGHAIAMDFAELEQKEGVRLSWNAWPSSRIEATRVVLPFGAVCTPCKPMPEMPVLPYAPVVCTECSAVLNPYGMVDYHQKRWQCCLCNTGNALPRNYHGT
jgi:hypothetical protein|tara:strand:+ start:131 stop:568 length:438 start_codon:yes stop_codon:yes gene_type:complete